MSDTIENIKEASSIEAAPQITTGDKRLRWFEVSLVLLISVGGSVLNSLYLLRNGLEIQPSTHSSRWTIQFAQEAGCLLLLGYVLSRRKLRFRDLGMRWSFRDLGAGILVTVVAWLSYTVGYALIYLLHNALFHSALTAVSVSQIFGKLSIMAIPVFLLNPFFEELIVRAYLMTELKDLTGSWILSAAVSVVIQGSYHLYYGWQGAIALSFEFLVFSIYYARTRRATPIIFAHGFFDIYGLVKIW